MPSANTTVDHGPMITATVPQDSIIGNWEQIILRYRVVPGYANEQTSPDLQTAVSLSIMQTEH